MKGALFSAAVLGVVLLGFAFGSRLLPQPGPATPQLLTKMSHALESERSGRFVGTMTIGGKGSVSGESFSTTAKISGEFSGPQLSISVTTDSSSASKVDLMLLNQGIYFRLDGSQWQGYPLDFVNALTPMASSSFSGATALSEMLKGLSGLRGLSFAGPSIDGTDTWEVRPMLLGSKLFSSSSASSNALLASLRPTLYLGREDSLPRELKLDMSITSDELGDNNALAYYVSHLSMGLDLKFSDWGKPVVLKPPRNAINEFRVLQDAMDQGGVALRLPQILSGS